MFGLQKNETNAEPGKDAAVQTGLLIYAAPEVADDLNFTADLGRMIEPQPTTRGDPDVINARDFERINAVLAVWQDAYTLSAIQEQVNLQRERRKNGFPVLVVALRPEQLAEIGSWLHERAVAGELQGIRLILTGSLDDIVAQIGDKLEPVTETNVIAMPVSTDIENSPLKYFYCISPQLRQLLTIMRGLAENHVHRIYLLGGPGSGKTSIAYFYYLSRARGRFVTVNLASESTGDKAAMKSLLCGHVSGAFPGATAREGAFSMARDGVAFLDESHGVTGVVMEILMEALDNGQFMPYGATTKRPLDCAVVFASNRSWESLRNSIALDEHARLGATLMGLPDLSKRVEDMIAVLATTMAKLGSQCTTWAPPYGITNDAWFAIRECAWRGNMRALIRVIETAFITAAATAPDYQLIQEDHIREGIELWEPSEHDSHRIYTSI